MFLYGKCFSGKNTYLSNHFAAETSDIVIGPFFISRYQYLRHAFLHPRKKYQINWLTLPTGSTSVSCGKMAPKQTFTGFEKGDDTVPTKKFERLSEQKKTSESISFSNVLNLGLVVLVGLYLFFLNLRSGVNVLCEVNESGNFVLPKVFHMEKEGCHALPISVKVSKPSNERRGFIHRLSFWKRNKSNPQPALTQDDLVENGKSADLTKTNGFVCNNAVYFLKQARGIFPFVPPVPIESSCEASSQEESTSRPIQNGQKMNQTFGRKHPIKHIVDKTTAFFNRRRQTRELKQKEENAKHNKAETLPDGVPDWCKLSYTDMRTPLTTIQKNQITELSSSVKSRIDKDTNENKLSLTFQERMDKVSWGGFGPSFWSRSGKDDTRGYNGDGFLLLASYLKIMEWPQVKILVQMTYFFSSYLFFYFLI